MLTEIQLEPCPFCGEKENIYYCRTVNGFDYIECQNCGADVHFWQTSDKKIGAIEAWNRRADIESV